MRRISSNGPIDNPNFLNLSIPTKTGTQGSHNQHVVEGTSHLSSCTIDNNASRRYSPEIPVTWNARHRLRVHAHCKNLLIIVIDEESILQFS